MRKHEIVDPYATARFGSLWQVVVHATEQDEDRHALYGEACQSMLDTGTWREYRLVYFSLRSGFRIHVGYRYARPTDWFTINDETDEIDGPFASKKFILRRYRLKRSRKMSPGVYALDHENLIAFTRERAEAVGVNPEELQ